jgi:DNA mismatch endonuclease (patch repair protein)
MDVHDRETRSFNMSQIRAKNTKPEKLVRSYLFSQGFRFRLHAKNLPGKPDVVLPKLKTVIFINGCFWHGHQGCKYFKVPKTRTKWWNSKIAKTREIDALNIQNLEQLGWQVLTIFECELKAGSVDITCQRLKDKLERNLA